MFRIDNSTAVAVEPTPGAVGPNPNGYFTAPDPMTSTPGTVMSADWCNAVQEEICNVISAASITLSKTAQNQLLTAINTIIGNTITSRQFTWELVTADLTLAAKTGYVTNSGSTTVNLLLPATIPFGSMIKIVRFNGNFNITQNDGQTIWYGTTSTTPGSSGYITPTGNNASVDLLCVVANTTFVVVNSQGAFTVN